MDGKAGQEYDGVGARAFSADGKHVAYVAVTGTMDCVVVDGQAGPTYGGVPCGPVFRADGVMEYLAISKEPGSVLYRVTYRF